MDRGSLMSRFFKVLPSLVRANSGTQILSGLEGVVRLEVDWRKLNLFLVRID
jgi:hypothetical protein